MQGKGILICNEIHPARAKILSENVERMGLTNAVVTNESPERLSAYFPEYFDKILVDAPCSGEGMFRKHEEACSEWSPENVELCAKRQDSVLDEAAAMLKKGGRLVYSTCTFALQEDEGSVARFLLRHPEFSIKEAHRYDGMEPGRPDWAEPSRPGRNGKDPFVSGPISCMEKDIFWRCLKKQGKCRRDTGRAACMESRKELRPRILLHGKNLNEKA